jgi:hypothetical protein
MCMKYEELRLVKAIFEEQIQRMYPIWIMKSHSDQDTLELETTWYAGSEIGPHISEHLVLTGMTR